MMSKQASLARLLMSTLLRSGATLFINAMPEISSVLWRLHEATYLKSLWLCKLLLSTIIYNDSIERD